MSVLFKVYYIGTVQSFNNTAHYNIDLGITWS